MSKCYCETVYDGYCGHCFDTMERERDEAREALKRGEETAARMLKVTIKERDEARELIEQDSTHLEAILINRNKPLMPHHIGWIRERLGYFTDDELDLAIRTEAWRKAAGMKEK